MDEIKYGIKPVGFSTPEPERKIVVPSNELMALFKKWYDSLDWHDHRRDHQYYAAVELIQTLKTISVGDVYGFLNEIYAQEGNKDFRLGLFVSALYNRCDDKIIPYNLPQTMITPSLAYRLNGDKIFVNTTTIGSNAGYFSNALFINYGLVAASFCADEVQNAQRSSVRVLNYGEISANLGHRAGRNSVVINLGKATHNAGYGAQGVLINYGETGTNLGYEAESSVIIVNVGRASRGMARNVEGRILCLQEPEGYGANIGSAKLRLKAKDCARIPALQEYFENIRLQLEAGRNDVDKAIQSMQSLSRDKIEQDLERIITTAGYKW